MAKLIITMNGESGREISLAEGRLAIGRAMHNNVVVDHPGVSAEHAAIVIARNEALLQDLGSTNGTRVNGQPVMRHFLQDGDVIELADCEMRYALEMEVSNTLACCNDFPPLDAVSNTLTVPTQAMPSTAGLQIKILNGAHAGKTYMLAKPLITLGRPGSEVAAIVSLSEGPVLLHVRGGCLSRVNGETVEEKGRKLQPGDVMELSGTQMQLMQAEA